jgi:F-type H+-transporting ATPase subunit delta
MSEIRVASRYAQSLLDIAGEKNLLERIESDANAFIRVCNETKAFDMMVKSPIINADKKRAVIEKIFGEQLHEVTFAFINIVLRKKREIVLKQIFQQYIAYYREMKGILSATVYTAVPVSEKIKEDIKNFLQKQTSSQVELDTQVNAEILGGFVIKYEDKLVDASVATQLKSLRKHLINHN